MPYVDDGGVAQHTGRSAAKANAAGRLVVTYRRRKSSVKLFLYYLFAKLTFGVDLARNARMTNQFCLEVVSSME